MIFGTILYITVVVGCGSYPTRGYLEGFCIEPCLKTDITAFWQCVLIDSLIEAKGNDEVLHRAISYYTDLDRVADAESEDWMKELTHRFDEDSIIFQPHTEESAKAFDAWLSGRHFLKIIIIQSRHSMVYSETRCNSWYLDLWSFDRSLTIYKPTSDDKPKIYDSVQIRSRHR